MKPLADWPASNGRNLTILGTYWRRTVARNRFFAKFAADDPMEDGMTANIMTFIKTKALKKMNFRRQIKTNT